MSARWTVGLVVAAAVAACGQGEPTATLSQAIVDGSPATAYPEAVTLTSDGYIPCSGVLLTPTVVLSAGHCRGHMSSYAVVAPNSGGQSAHGSASWSPYTGSPAKSPDVMLVFLDTPIHLATYPTLQAGAVAAGTQVVDIGRTLNGAIGTSDNESPPVTIEGPATSLGFPYSYEALPDLSENGDSGGPIMLAGTHTIVAIVDTDTTEQGIAETTPIDLFVRMDLVHDAIAAAIAAGPTDAGAHDAGDASVSTASGGGSHGGCDVAGPGAPCRGGALLALVGIAVLRRRGKRRRLLGAGQAAALQADFP